MITEFTGISVFSIPGTNSYSFNLITGPGFLLYRGDMGCFEFERLHDMFVFFRNNKPEYHLKHGMTVPINEHYWSEKLEAIDKNGGYQRYSETLFLERIEELTVNYLDDNPEIDKDDFRYEVKSDILSQSEFEVEAYHAASDFRYYGD